MRTRKPTIRQLEVLEFIKAHRQSEDAYPTRREIAQHFGFKSDNAAEEHIQALANHGLLELRPGKTRGIRVPR